MRKFLLNWPMLNDIFEGPPEATPGLSKKYVFFCVQKLIYFSFVQIFWGM